MMIVIVKTVLIGLVMVGMVMSILCINRMFDEEISAEEESYNPLKPCRQEAEEEFGNPLDIFRRLWGR
ncbi:MAG: hypothetical protein K2M13_04850 [Muribaculaceae bacterium]|nr:hypothetical protein [Muribaculaceae bacterium]